MNFGESENIIESDFIAQVDKREGESTKWFLTVCSNKKNL